MGKWIYKKNKERIKAAAAASLGAGVGGAGGATAGVLELAAQGAATELSAGLVIGLGTIAGGLVSFCGYKAYRYLRSKNSTGTDSKGSA
ncbi:MAG: hypothetical protein JO323_08930 [Acidobacteriia bacterium]|nr:hypothetical protein [Terriglobia bacterium]